MRRRCAPLLAGRRDCSGCSSASRRSAAAATLGTFGTPTATSTFGRGSTFSQPVTVNEPLGSRRAAADQSPTRSDRRSASLPAAVHGRDDADLHARHRRDGHILIPNTPIDGALATRVADRHAVPRALGPEVKVVYADDRFDWKTDAGALVRVHWYEGERRVRRQRALKIGEDEVADDVRAARRDRDRSRSTSSSTPTRRRSTTRSGRATRENVGGEAVRRHPDAVRAHPARPDRRRVGRRPSSRTSSIHLVFDTAAKNPYHFPPRWLNEGLAVYQSEGYGADDRVAGRGRRPRRAR